MERKDETQYQFTKYLETAVKRCRRDYLNKKFRKDKMESPMDIEDFQTLQSGYSYREYWDKDMEVPLDITDMMDFLTEHMGEKMWEAQKKLRDVELEILCMRVLKQYSYKEIGVRLHMSEKQAASVYNYAKRNWVRN
ncbi:sigma-70 family RNA polymerase sigma factor [Enterocloster clostridioformis]|nr:hypothetical protein A4V08_03385 [Lachnoclostridium sp. YL32]NDO27621.1 sigma-70 family RNA polymerase sigma factor [Enterocloster clostridioformis]OXE70079.1 sigma-70 family RNA polymerase sigma factor [Enterocloster clostridioformis]QQR00222.1 sigma-70 family RNA polymerase sigma factor [Enterocloster clostridioformis]